MASEPMTAAELEAIRARTAETPTWACNTQRSRAPQMRADLDALIAEVDRLLAEVRRLTPAPKVAVWEAGNGRWAGYTILRDATSRRRIRMYGPSTVYGWCAVYLDNGDYDQRFQTEPEARAHIDACAKSEGWEVRDGQ